MKLPALVLPALVVSWAAWVTPAAAADRLESEMDALVQLAQSRKCVRLNTIDGRRTLINLCNVCRTVKLKHKRPGVEGGPIFRTLMVPARARVRVSLLGPGRTQVIADENCAAGEQQLQEATASAPRCVRLARSKSGGLLMVNTCKACRAVVVERVFAGGRRKSAAYSINGGASLPLSPDGAAQFRLPAEQSCP